MPWVTPVLLLGVGAVAVHGWWRSDERKFASAMKRAPLWHVGFMPHEELVRVVGTVEVDQPLVAPLTGRPCAHWRAVVEQSGHTNLTTPTVLVDDQKTVDFHLVDGGERLLVRARQVQGPFKVGAARVMARTGMTTTPRAVEDFLTARSVTPKRGFLRTKQLYTSESIIEPGRRVALVGFARRERDPHANPKAAGSYRGTRQEERLVFVDPPGGPMLASDDPKLLA